MKPELEYKIFPLGYSIDPVTGERKPLSKEQQEWSDKVTDQAMQQSQTNMDLAVRLEEIVAALKTQDNNAAIPCVNVLIDAAKRLRSKPPKERRTRIINEIGIGFAGKANEKMTDIRVYCESGSVLVWAEIKEKNAEALQYLTPEEAMAFSRAFERCAIQALKENMEILYDRE